MLPRQLGQQVRHGLRGGRRCGDEQAHLVGVLVQLELQEGATAALRLHKLADACRRFRRVAQVEGEPATLDAPKGIPAQRGDFGEPAPVVRR